MPALLFQAYHRGRSVMSGVGLFCPVLCFRMGGGFNQFMGLYIDRMEALGALDDFEADRLPGLERTIAVHLDC